MTDLGRANPTFEQYLVQLESGQYQQMDLTEMWAVPQGAERGVQRQIGVLGVTGRFCSLRHLPEVKTSDKLLIKLIISSSDAVNGR